MKDENVKQMNVTIQIYPPKSEEARCLCKLKKEDVVKHFSLIERRLEKVEEIVDAISVSLMVEDIEKEKWLATKTDVDAFLRLILNGKDNLVCMMEKLLRTTGQTKLLEIITARDETNSTPDISADDIRQHRHQIVDELEPRKFVDMLRGIPKSDEVVEKIMKTEVSRQKRCEALVTFVLKSKSEKLFQQELIKQQMSYLIKLLTSTRGNANSLYCKQVKEALLASLGEITESLEASRFKKYLVRKPEMSGEDFKTICKHSTRKRRVFALMEKIIHGPDILIERFINGLDELDYGDISKLIKERAETYKECPRLHITTLQGKTVVFKGSFEIKYETCDADSETLLENLISEFSDDKKDRADDDNDQTSKDLLKDARVSAWVITQHALIQHGFIDVEIEDLSTSKILLMLLTIFVFVIFLIIRNDQQNTKGVTDSPADESISVSSIVPQSPPCGTSDETLTTVSSQAPTSPLSSPYEETPSSSPVCYEPTRAHKRTNFLLDEEELSRGSSGYLTMF